MDNLIISIDWDHTLRKTEGLDINLLILVLYALAKKIPIGLTTHRDIESTVLYSLYFWQNHPPKYNEEALSAFISYWQTLFFTPMNIEFDFINARYQPISGNQNYYSSVLLPLEKKLADEIVVNDILKEPHIVRLKILEYTSQKESLTESDQFKEKQMEWICNKYKGQLPINIVHIDDNETLTHNLPLIFSQVSRTLHASVKTIFVQDNFVLLNEDFLSFLNNIGLIKYAESILSPDFKITKKINSKELLSACLLLGQLNYANIEITSKIIKILDDLEIDIFPELAFTLKFIKQVVSAVETIKKPVKLLANNLQDFIF